MVSLLVPTESVNKENSYSELVKLVCAVQPDCVFVEKCFGGYYFCLEVENKIVPFFRFDWFHLFFIAIF